jgi:penicillin-binding protein 1B
MKKLKTWLSWMFIAGLVAGCTLLVYSVYLFQELEPLMNQNLKSQPSVIYSDFYVLKKGENYPDTFLEERLRDMRITFNTTAPSETERRIEWKAKPFAYPEAVLSVDSPLRIKIEQQVSVLVKDDRIDQIQLEGADAEAIALDPFAIAQISGSSREIRNYVKLENIPTRLLQAIIAIEDQRFLEHPGFDLRSLARALWVNMRARAMSQGGSTITQQLVKNLLGTTQKTLLRKARELVLAILIEAKYSKDVILEKYLNEVYVGQSGALEIHGVADAARYLYNKPLEKITLAEMAVIAGMIRGPVYYSPYKHKDRALERKDTVLRKMEELMIITPDELKTALNEKLTFSPPSLVNNRAPYFADYVKSQVLEELGERISADELSAEGLRIFTTLDPVLQKRADQAVANTVKDLETRFKIAAPLRLEGLFVAADPKTGSVRALVGGRSYAETTFNRVLNMKRQVGSTFKPIAYLAALLKGRDDKGVPYSGAYMVDDEPWSHKIKGLGTNKTWTPHNYERGFRGHITLREAFENSINIPMAKIAIEVGADRIIETAHKLGIKEHLPAIPSLSLGSIDLRPLDLLQAYATIANRGERVELTTVKAIVDENGALIARHVPQVSQEFEPAVMDVLGELLKGVVNNGTAKALKQMGYIKTARGKTGTTSFYRDAWFAGYSQGLVAVTWTGFDELKTPDMEDEAAVKKFKSPATLTGAGAALPTWAKFFVAAKPSKIEDIEAPLDPSIEMKKIDKSTGGLAKGSCPQQFVYEEGFLPNTAPEKECAVH